MPSSSASRSRRPTSTSACTASSRRRAAGDKLIHYGLGAVKGTGQGAVEAIVAAREAHRAERRGAPFTSLFDFAKRVDRSRVNKRVVDALVKAGGFDLLHPDRACALASVGLAFEWADAQAAHAQQSGLFDFGGADEHGASTQEPALVQAEPWSIREKLTLEKTAIGFYLSGHMFDQYEPEVRKFCKRRIADLIDFARAADAVRHRQRPAHHQRPARPRGHLQGGRQAARRSRRWPTRNCSTPTATRCATTNCVVVQGKVQPDRFSGGLRLNVTQVWDLAAARARFGRYLRCRSTATSRRSPRWSQVAGAPRRRPSTASCHPRAGRAHQGAHRARGRRTRPRRPGPLLAQRRRAGALEADLRDAGRHRSCTTERRGR